jgi:hypothetical protein
MSGGMWDIPSDFVSGNKIGSDHACLSCASESRRSSFRLQWTLCYWKQAGHGTKEQTVYRIEVPYARDAAERGNVEAVEGGCEVEREDSNE